MSNPPIASAREVNAPAELVPPLLVDVAAWRIWSPHIAWVESPRGTMAAGWRGSVGPALTRIAEPLSAFGQRRPLDRLAALAELPRELEAAPG